MACRIVQLLAPDGSKRVAAFGPDEVARCLSGVASSYELAFDAIDQGIAVRALVGTIGQRFAGIDGIETVKTFLDSPAVISAFFDDVDFLKSILPDVRRK